MTQLDRFEDLDVDDFTTEQDGHIGIVRLNRPPANAHNIDMVLQLQKIVETIRFDNDIRVAVLSSENEKVFSSGFDIQALQDKPGDQIGYASQTSKEVIMKMRTTDTIFIAAVDGHCMGGGLEFALACDFRYIGDEDDFRVGVPEVELGLIPGEAGTQLLPRYVGRSEALRLMVTGEEITPTYGEEIGLFDELVEPGTVEDEALEFAEELVEKPNQAIGFDKLAVNEGMELGLWDALAHERELQNQLFETPAAEEGVSAFLDKREPDFLGAEIDE